VPWLALSAGALSMSASVYSAFDVTGYPKLSAQLQWTRLLILSVAAFLICYVTRNATYVAAARFAVTIALTPALLVVLARTVDFPIRSILLSIWRPGIAAIAMSATVWTINAHLQSGGIIRLLIDVLSGGVVFCLTCLLLWRLVGRPHAPEAYVWSRIPARLRPA